MDGPNCPIFVFYKIFITPLRNRPSQRADASSTISKPCLHRNGALTGKTNAARPPHRASTRNRPSPSRRSNRGAYRFAIQIAIASHASFNPTPPPSITHPLSMPPQFNLSSTICWHLLAHDAAKMAIACRANAAHKNTYYASARASSCRWRCAAISSWYSTSAHKCATIDKRRPSVPPTLPLAQQHLANNWPITQSQHVLFLSPVQGVRPLAKAPLHSRRSLFQRSHRVVLPQVLHCLRCVRSPNRLRMRWPTRRRATLRH